MITEASPTSTVPIRCVMAIAVSSQRVEAESQIFCLGVERERARQEEVEFFFRFDLAKFSLVKKKLPKLLFSLPPSL